MYRLPRVIVLMILMQLLAGCQPQTTPQNNTAVNNETKPTTELEVPINTERATPTPPPSEELKIEEKISEKPTPIAARYTEYTQELHDSLNGKQPYAIFFYAEWCPKCVEMDQQFQSNINNFPEGTVILKADYNAETKLKAKYDITIQSSIVTINENGKVEEKLTYTNYEKAVESIFKVTKNFFN